MTDPATAELIVHGSEWTVKQLFVYPNEFIYWSIQIVMYPYMTGLVAGAFVLSSLYHVFGQKDLKDMARFSLVFSLCLLPVAMMPPSDRLPADSKPATSSPCQQWTETAICASASTARSVSTPNSA